MLIDIVHRDADICTYQGFDISAFTHLLLQLPCNKNSVNIQLHDLLHDVLLLLGAPGSLLGVEQFCGIMNTLGEAGFCCFKLLQLSIRLPCLQDDAHQISLKYDCILDWKCQLILVNQQEWGRE